VRYLGLDVGDRRIGVALSDESATLASPLLTFERVGPRKDLKAVAAMVRERGATEVVVGLPRRLDGTIGAQAQKVLDFMDALQPVARVPVVPWDERLTTVAAHQALAEAGMGWRERRERRGLVDKVSATLILQGYLDYRKMAEADGRRPAQP
jgi:putative holliday junction resolvase